MIRFTLNCENGHGFDAWFRNNDDFETQAKRGFVECPECGASRVSKALMAPAVSTARKREQIAVALDRERSEVMAKLREMSREVKANAENVGDRFAEEARKIHFGEVDHRAIYGKASREEVEALAEDGVPFAPLIDLPDELN